MHPLATKNFSQPRISNQLQRLRIQCCERQTHTGLPQPLLRLGQHLECGVLKVRYRTAINDHHLRLVFLNQSRHQLADPLRIGKMNDPFGLE